MPKEFHGHPRFYRLTEQEEELHSAKNKDYAGGGQPLGNFDRSAAILRLYPGFPVDANFGIAIIHMLKQLDAAMWLISTGRMGEVEGVPERLGDVSIYAKLARIMYEEHNQEALDEKGPSSR